MKDSEYIELIQELGFEKIVNKITIGKNHAFIYSGDPLSKITVNVVSLKEAKDDIDIDTIEREYSHKAFDSIKLNPNHLEYKATLKEIGRANKELCKINYTDDTLMSELKKQLVNSNYDSFYGNIIAIKHGLEVYIFNP